MEEVLYDMKNLKIHRNLPNTWSGEKLGFAGKAVDGALELSRYAEKLYYSLLCIRHYYKDFFNDNNTTSIDDYIRVFDDVYNEIYDTLVDSKSSIAYITNLTFKGALWLTKGRFAVLQNSESYNKNCFLYKHGKSIGFSDEAYQKVKPLAKKLFMLEKLCSFTTRKIWKEEMTKPENFDAKKDFNVLARVILPKTWRFHEHDQNYEKDRIYFSTSLINKSTRNKLFMQRFIDEMAILLIEYEDDKFVCGDADDNFSEEEINGYTPNKNRTEYTDVFAIDEIDVDGKNHKMFANAVETATPMSIFRSLNQSLYSEINMKNPKVFGVVAPNEESINFAKKKAEELGVKYISPEEFNR